MALYISLIHYHSYGIFRQKSRLSDTTFYWSTNSLQTFEVLFGFLGFLERSEVLTFGARPQTSKHPERPKIQNVCNPEHSKPNCRLKAIIYSFEQIHINRT